MSTAIFEFKGYSIQNLIYTKHPVEDYKYNLPEDKMEFSVNLAFSDDFQKAKLGMQVDLKGEENKSFLTLEIDGYFDIDESLFKDEKGGNRDEIEFSKIFTLNGTAILYPYLRSTVSMITSLDNSNSIILPTLNLRSFINDLE